MTIELTHGPVIGRADIEEKVLAHVDHWLVYYLARIEEQLELPPRTLAVPKSYRVTDAFTRNPEDALPLVDVISPGTNQGRRPQRDGDGSIRAWWTVAVGAVVSASETQTAKNLAGYYGAAILMLMTQMPDLGDWASDCEWEGDTYDDWDVHDTERTIAAVRSVYTVSVQSVLNVYLGPGDSTAYPEDPYTALPLPGVVREASVETEKM